MRKRAFVLAALLALPVAFGLQSATPARATGDCTANAVVCENELPGSPRSEWDVVGAGDSSIQGFATDISVDRGQTVHFKVKANADAYRIDIYRIGYYGGDGARQVATVLPSAALPQSQPTCLDQPSTGLVDCGNWAESASWSVPSDAVSGVYIAKLVRTDTGGASHMIFVVRDDASHSDLMFQTSDTTWEAYNQYGGNSLYVGSPANRAYKVSYNRPFTTREYASPSWFFEDEYPMIRWLERNGYDMSYSTGVDTDRRGGELLQHQAFISAGHDEYWSAGQRASVEAARAAGVNLAFLSGNAMFWKTRWENSIDGTGTSFRTLVTYKETKANEKIDPTSTWTGTWRDNRFSPPADGGRPENALQGTLWTVDAYRQDPMNVPAADGRLRFWRNTSVATLASGEVATIPAGILGHEWDEDVDNGFRPAGLMDMSSTTVHVDEHLVDEGNTYVEGNATHHITMYRAASGALVFGAGTCQWGWALDTHHDVFSGTAPPADARIQQGTVNLFADMGVQPGSLQADLLPASASTDTAVPNSTITAPGPSAVLDSGSQVTVTGTASDAGGGTVAAVEISVDGGSTWHPASGRQNWSYQWTVGGIGQVTIRSRAVDDSGNIETSGGSTVTVVVCPCSLWGAPSTPSIASSNDRQSVELGMRFRADMNGYVTGMHFYKGLDNLGTHVGSLWTSSGTLLARTTFAGESPTGWQEAAFDHAVPITAGTSYVVSYNAPRGGYSLDLFGFTSAIANPPLHGIADGVGGGNGVYSYSSTPTFPTDTFSSSNYWVDVVFNTAIPPDTTSPTVTSVSPADGSSSAGPGSSVTATFSEAIDPATLTGNMLLRDPAGTLVPATVTYDSATRTATLDPTAALADSTAFTATLKGGANGIKDLAGNALASDHSWTFTTAAQAGCPCTLWSPSATPQIASSGDHGSVELGLKFRSDITGSVTGIRFYKGAANTGTHTGNLWSASGTLLARVTFTGESASGWQQANFDTAVPITAGTTYIASYFAPNGGYSVDPSYFASSGFANQPLRALQNGVEGGNGVFRYGPQTAFPDDTWGSSNYWVDVVFNTDQGPDTSPPQVTDVSPADGSSSAGPGSSVTATFSEAIDPATLTGNMLLRDPAGTLVPATVTYDSATRTATLDPTAALADSTAFTATLKGGANGIKDLAGNALASDHSWTFTTAAQAGCPCTLWSPSATPQIASSGDHGSVELGLKFRSDITGSVTGIRFYKGAANTGTHTGNLWSASGTLLARVTFTGESASGWQQANFDTAVPITAGTTYIASYFAPNGGYSVDPSYFASSGFANQPLRALQNGVEGGNGVFRYGPQTAFPDDTWGSSNYWVDVVFNTNEGPDSSPPRVLSVTPADGAQNMAVDSDVSMTFSKPIDASTLAGNAIIRDGSGANVPATVTYDSATRTVRLHPSVALSYATTYTATIHGGTTGIKDTDGNALVTDFTSSFGTSTCPCSIFSSTFAPQIASSSDHGSVELGLKFRSDVNGQVTGIRFYKGLDNTGLHVGSLWSSSGTLLAQAFFTNETSAGWQAAIFASPVSITAGTTYVASYHAPSGGYSVDPHFFATTGIVNAPLRALANGVDGPNGVYAYGPSSSFPTDTYDSFNYSVDVSFTPAG